MLSTISLVLTIGYLFSLWPDFKSWAIFLTWMFSLSALACGIIPCILGALLNQSKLLNFNFTSKSFISWLFSFLLTLVIWVVTGLSGSPSETWGRFTLIIFPAIFSCITWLYFSRRLLKNS